MTTAAQDQTAALRDWVQELAGPVTELRQLVSGNSRTTWLGTADTPDGPLRFVLRTEAGDGPFEGTELTLDREAAVYAALGATDVLTPRLLGHRSDLNAIAMTALDGTADWADEAIDPYLGELARLHRVDAAALELPGYATTAWGDVELWGTLAAGLHVQDPVVAFALEVLRETFPGEPEKLVLCHGDAGPGNFLHDGPRTTGLLDWEFAHLGDPIDDLAWISIRPVLFGVELPGFGERIAAHYAGAAGVALDPARLRYWQAVVVLRNLVTCLASVGNPARGRDRLVHHMLIPSLDRMLATALAAILGVTLDAPEPAPEAREVPGQDVLAELALTAGELAAGMEDPAQRARAKRIRFLLAQLAGNASHMGAAADGDAADGPPATDREDRLRQLARAADRKLWLFPKAQAMAYAPLPGFEPST